MTRSATAISRHPTVVASRAAALVTAFTLAIAALFTVAAPARPADANTTEKTFVAKLNHARNIRGIPLLNRKAALTRVAREQARRMADADRLYHNPRLSTDVRNWRWLGENVGYGPDALTIHRAFMNSPSHRANILDRDYAQVGIGTVVRSGRVWVAEVFRRPLRIRTSGRNTMADAR
jgi:uncharacterized protein YkwD